MKKQVTEKKEWRSPLARVLHSVELPEYLWSQQCHVEIIGKHQVIADNIRGITEYDEQLVKLVLSEGSLMVLGRDLTLDTVEKTTVVIRGKISAVEFL